MYLRIYYNVYTTINTYAGGTMPSARVQREGAGGGGAGPAPA